IPARLVTTSASCSKPEFEYSRRVPGAATAAWTAKARPLVWASRCRTVDPSGPAGSSSVRARSSTAITVTYAVSSSVTDAVRNVRFRSPYENATWPSGRTAAAAAWSTGQDEICSAAALMAPTLSDGVRHPLRLLLEPTLVGPGDDGEGECGQRESDGDPDRRHVTPPGRDHQPSGPRPDGVADVER